ncbi:hypothetical protein Acid345_0342 [Candidatus Koribacter versatilis Ellin345]|uniref:Uncharacterized protein n=1 Tax=Koribacter versatilis (strain Ellin345) TaxID=204669 RepID=Q1IUV3_KORVE|nr:hypothetical protein Acid345_0342 [Candidatus Koribacter versatilis Ellin345]
MTKRRQGCSGTMRDVRDRTVLQTAGFASGSIWPLPLQAEQSAMRAPWQAGHAWFSTNNRDFTPVPEHAGHVTRPEPLQTGHSIPNIVVISRDSRIADLFPHPSKTETRNRHRVLASPMAR